MALMKGTCALEVQSEDDDIHASLRQDISCMPPGRVVLQDW